MFLNIRSNVPRGTLSPPVHETPNRLGVDARQMVHRRTALRSCQGVMGAMFHVERCLYVELCFVLHTSFCFAHNF